MKILANTGQESYFQISDVNGGFADFGLERRFFGQLESILQFEIKARLLKTVFRLAELPFEGGCRIIQNYIYL
jgi:hypothetical protein